MSLKKVLIIIGLICITFNVCNAQNLEDMELLATTATKEDTWSLSVFRDGDGEYYFIVGDYVTKQGGIAKYERKIYDFYINKSKYGDYDPLIFTMLISNSPHDVDADYGEWYEDYHAMPFYVLFDYVEGEVVIESYVSSGSGLNPSHYQGRIKSPYHLKLVEIFLTHMPKLHKIVEDNRLYLP